MLLQKIEKYSQPSFLQSQTPQSKANLQSCYYNLKNLQKMVDQGYLHITQSNKEKRTSTALKPVSSNIKLPQISAVTMRSDIDFSYSHAFMVGNQNQSSLKQSNNNDVSRTLQSVLNGTLLNNNKIKPRLKQFLEKTKIKSIEKFLESSNSKEEPNSNERRPKIMKIKNYKKNCRFRPGLNKDQQFFQQTDVHLKTQIVEKIGLYEASNIYKTNNVTKFLKQGYEKNFKPVINLKFVTFSLCDRNQFFLTDNCNLPELHQAEACFDLPKKKNNIINKQIKQTEICGKSQKDGSNGDRVIQTISDQISTKERIEEQEKKTVKWLITIQNYEVIKNEQYYGLKNYNIEQWSEINFILYTIGQYLKKIKISLLSFKFDKASFMKQLWSCRRISEKTLQQLLKIKITVGNQERQSYKSVRVYKQKAEVVKQLMKVWRARQYLLSMKKQKQKQKERLVWTAIRMTAKHKMMLAKKRRKARAQILNEKLRNGDWDHQIEIHIPSFSETDFVRNTTQYMQHYQNMFYHMWKSSNNKHFVLIIPAINQTILKIYQQKIKLHKNITLICPESHQIYPKSLPLSASLLYSKEALYKVKRILQGKKGIIIPGRQLSNNHLYQQHLSDLLNCPLFSTLNIPKQIGYHKKIWSSYNIPTATFKIVEPRSSMHNVIQKLSDLIYDYQDIKVWVLKMNKQFNGRGIAKFDTTSSKKLKQILNLSRDSEISGEMGRSDQKINDKRIKQIKQFIMQYLNVHFRLKLKVNFQNCIFRVEEYIQTFLENGGVIQEYIEDHQTFQICYKLEPGYASYSNLFILDQIEEQKYICCAQNYEVDFVTKSTVFLHDNIPKKIKQISKQICKILKQQKYLGYISVTVLYCPKQESALAIQIKPYMTINSSMSYMLKVFSKKKGTNLATNRRLGGLISNTNIQSLAQITNNEPAGTKLVFIFIPYIIFTDVDEETRSHIIQNLVLSSWQKISTKLFQQPIVTQNSDTFHGTLYMSLGLTLGILLYGKPFDIKRMKSSAIDCVRELSDKVELTKLYRGKQQARDVFQFGDLIRAITKIKS